MFPDSSRAAWLPSLGQQVTVIMSINGPSYLARVYYIYRLNWSNIKQRLICGNDK